MLSEDSLHHSLPLSCAVSNRQRRSDGQTMTVALGRPRPGERSGLFRDRDCSCTYPAHPPTGAPCPRTGQVSTTDRVPAAPGAHHRAREGGDGHAESEHPAHFLLLVLGIGWLFKSKAWHFPSVLNVFQTLSLQIMLLPLSLFPVLPSSS